MTVPPPPSGQRFNPPPGWPAVDPNWMPPPGWQPPPEFPPAPPNWQWYTPVAAPERKGFIRRHKILTGLAAVVLLIIIIAVSTSSGSKGSPNAKSSPATTGSSTAASAPSTAPTTQAPAPPPAAPKVLFSLAGSGIKAGTPFTVPNGHATLSYTYNCAAFGQSGNFAVTVADNTGALADLPVNELGTKGASSTQLYGLNGPVHLEVNSECDWTVKVTG